MEWERVRLQIERIFNIPVKTERWPWEQWLGETKRLATPMPLTEEDTAPAADILSVIRDNDIVFLAAREGAFAIVLSMDARAVTNQERQLVELMLDMSRQPNTKEEIVEEELRVVELRDWIHQQHNLGVRDAELPDAFVSGLSLFSRKVPFLLTGEYSYARGGSYPELKKLLESFFESEIVLVPLNEKEWLIMASDKLLSMDSTDEKELGEEERLEDKLAAIGFGLHEMLDSEWVGDSHLALHYPILPVKELYGTVVKLRETMMLGRTYLVGSNVHMPWTLQLEKLIHGISEADKAAFVEQVLKRTEVALDNETVTTLEQFFALDCNVSETAKKLYIHRNTLLYRLDKFKQETGLDVRTFHDAVLVKICMLLYKVTKRK